MGQVGKKDRHETARIALCVLDLQMFSEYLKIKLVVVEMILKITATSCLRFSPQGSL